MRGGHARRTASLQTRSERKVKAGFSRRIAQLERLDLGATVDLGDDLLGGLDFLGHFEITAEEVI